MNRFAISFGNYFSASLQSPPADGPAAVSADPRLFSRQWSFRQQFFDDFVETADEFSDFLQRYFGVGRHKAVMPNFREAVRQHVLEIAPHKLEEFEFADAPLLLPAPAIFEMHMGSGDVEYPTRRNGDAEDILRQIFERSTTVADVACIDHPIRVPDAVGNAEAFGLELLDKLCTEYLAQGLNRASPYFLRKLSALCFGACTKKAGPELSHSVPSLLSPPPGTMKCTCG